LQSGLSADAALLLLLLLSVSIHLAKFPNSELFGIPGLGLSRPDMIPAVSNIRILHRQYQNIAPVGLLRKS